MGRLLQNLLSQRHAGLLGLVVLVLVIYLVGVLSGVPWLYLHLAAVAVVVLAVTVLLLQRRRAAKAAGALEAALKEQGRSQASGSRPDQRAGIEELKGQFDESLDLLRSSKMGPGALHTIPWYILIGPPGSGKSTLLRESGLSFPYMTKGRSAIRGLGGTKNCDWWFADRGILLDTAGRYTTEAEDRDEWMAFLRLLKRGRGRRPVNGAIVAIGLAELVEATDAELSLYAENVRDRIDELTRELQIVFPIYVVFTKCDRLRGFVETFDTLNKEQRKQVWGFTFPFERGKDFRLAEQFGKEFDELYRALTVRRVDLLASDHFKKRKAQVYAFPLQFLGLKERLQGFLDQLQQPNPYQEVSPVRGIYFTSGTQEGTTIDRILKVLRPAELVLDVPQESRRCYFVDDLFNQVVFTDATLATPTAKSLQRDRTLRIGGGIVLGVLALLTIVWRWSTMSAFGSACAQIEANIVGRKDRDPEQVRRALDAQLEMLESGNHHLERGGVIQNLRSHYEEALVAHTIERVEVHARAEVATVKERARQLASLGAAEAYAVRNELDRQLSRIDAGVLGLQSKADGDREAALSLWRAAVGTGAVAERHFENLRGIDGLELDIPAVAGDVRSAREQLQASLGAENERDLRAAKDLGLDRLFARSWQALNVLETPFSACAAVTDRNWSARALAASAKGPLFSSLSAKAGAPQLEQFFVTFEQDVELARARNGETSGQPLRDLPAGGWNDHVDQKRVAFLQLVDRGFDERWSQFLGAIEQVASTGADAGEEDLLGFTRLAVVPELVAAYGIAREVLLARGKVADDRRVELAKSVEPIKARHKPDQPSWAKTTGVVERGREPTATVERALRAKTYGDAERRRIEVFDWGITALQARFQDLELGLVRGMCQREWAACRAELQDHANKGALKAWQQVLDGFPFDPEAVDEADADELAKAVGSMAELAGFVAKLEPASAFEQDPAFVAAVQEAATLGRILYGSDKVRSVPGIETLLTVQTGGSSITAVTLQGQDRRAVVGRQQEWTIGPVEPLDLSIQLQSGGVLSFGDLLLSRGRVPAGLLVGQRMRPGMWQLKRLFDWGTITRSGPNDSRSELRLSGRTGDYVLLAVNVPRPEAAVVFDADWPGERYRPVKSVWKQP
ncbi:MAG: type VI secretion system membrane subunit TssM [Planctomycetes bacterium]|nr:type VI secretion system membrane subunit TssM [Planctomycetota bacterium]